MGEHQHTLDDKSRITVPVKFREALGSTFVLTRGLDKCLFVYPAAAWDTLETKLTSLSFTRADARSFVRFFFSGASECELDKQGRILIPASLREYAALTRDCVVLGVSNRVEIWDRALWTDYTTGVAQSFAEIAENLVDIVL